jgi:mannosyltransferase
LLAAGGYACVRGARQGRRWPHGFVAAWLAVPLALSFAVSLAKPMFVSRYLILCLPALVLFGAAGIAKARPPVVAAALAALLACYSGTRLIDHYGNPDSQNWRAATRYVVDSTRSGDAVIFFPTWASKPFGYYARRMGAPEPPKLGANELAEKRRIWLVIRGSDAAADPSGLRQRRSSLPERLRLSAKRSFTGVEVELYESDRSGRTQSIRPPGA